MKPDPFDLAKLQLTPEMQKALKPKPGHAHSKTWQRNHVVVPWSWVERLQFSESANTYRLALHLLYEHWRGGGKPVKLSNVGALEGADVTRYAKWRALQELEGLGLVKIERRRRYSPLVTLINP